MKNVVSFNGCSTLFPSDLFLSKVMMRDVFEAGSAFFFLFLLFNLTQSVERRHGRNIQEDKGLRRQGGWPNIRFQDSAVVRALSQSCYLHERIFSCRFPPVFHDWFIETFPEPTAWLASRLAYGRTAAVMSMVGFILGSDRFSILDFHC